LTFGSNALRGACRITLDGCLSCGLRAAAGFLERAVGKGALWIDQKFTRP
jgi:hypothetical protein